MGRSNYLKTGLMGASALILVGSRFIPGANSYVPVLAGASTLVAATRTLVPVDRMPEAGLLVKSRLYLAENTYEFHGHTGGRSYSSVGLRLRGVSENFNDNARSRGVVAHGAPYVTADRAGRSEGCPAMEQERARRVLPELAEGGMVFLFAPDRKWMMDDPWVAASAE
ncbi:MAG: hypothetical protein PVSMB1_00360 [Gemmatimonadaceae bacterium]